LGAEAFEGLLDGVEDAEGLLAGRVERGRGGGQRAARAQLLGQQLLPVVAGHVGVAPGLLDRKSTRLNSSHVKRSYAVFWLKKKTICDRVRSFESVLTNDDNVSLTLYSV